MSSSDGNTEARVRLFRRLDFALISLKQSRALCSHVQKLVSSGSFSGSDLYDACLTGIAVTFALPFGENEKLGTLSGQYRAGFPSVELTEAHRDLLHMRHTMYAHRNLEHGERIPTTDSSGLKFYTSRIEFTPSASGKGGAIRSMPFLPHVSPSSLPDIMALLEFQIERLNVVAAEVLVHLGKGKVYAPGIYIVGENFP
ncbi:MAG: hypothetical protein ABJB22_01860 [Verrucomicrobiota bacterium]